MKIATALTKMTMVPQTARNPPIGPSMTEKEWLVTSIAGRDATTMADHGLNSVPRAGVPAKATLSQNPIQSTSKSSVVAMA